MDRSTLYVEFEGAPGARRPIHARRRASRSGRKQRVVVEREAVELGHVFLLVRRGDGDMVLGASASREPLDAMHARLGPTRHAYDVARVPVVAG